ncbi:hypothetical protein SLS60_004415 [Paraconiothyrium brasiliense]|uniref:aldehyde dehydrogenase (NAD(+)) n=1 Tax=Paraconiothyrium brasiliense TaxID=300254 RepID=A0ABR3RKB9_9PLEO
MPNIKNITQSAELATFINEAGFPPGILNILSGHGHVSSGTLVGHMDVRALTFIGSTSTGRLIQWAAADSNPKNMILKLGGKSPTIIFEDADLETAAQQTAYSIQWNHGQDCMAKSRIYV